LQDIFGCCSGLDAPFQKRQKLPVSSNQSRNRFRRQGRGRCRFKTHPERLPHRRIACKVSAGLASAPLKAHEALNQTKEKHREQLQKNSVEQHREDELRLWLPMRNLFPRMSEVQMPVRLHKQEELKAKRR
jgi:hypothetical protein